MNQQQALVSEAIKGLVKYVIRSNKERRIESSSDFYQVCAAYVKFLTTHHFAILNALHIIAFVQRKPKRLKHANNDG